MRVLTLSILMLGAAAVACPGQKSGSEKKAASGQAKDNAAKAPPQVKAAKAARPNAPKQLPAPSDVAAPPADAEKTKSGLSSKVLEKGSGTEHPAAADTVRVHYTGWTTDGKMFDSSVTRGQPASFRLDRVIPGWTEGVQLMTVGEKRRLWIPEDLAYKGKPGVPQGMLVFDIELLAINKSIPAPKDVAKPPADAKKTASGLYSKVLKPGKGGDHPRDFDSVEVHYTGWTTDGNMFDSSVQRGQTAKFPLNRVIAGWTEGLQLMTVGEKRRLWIPEGLAYKGQPGRPAGMLVFDVELLSINKGKEPIPAPADVAAPPAKATKTDSGLAYIKLKKGKGDNKPKATSRVKVHYTGWTTDGKMFDSSVQRGQPTSFQLNQVIPGWTEVVQLMNVGDKVRTWIPQKLAYQGRPGPPKGMLVFEIELLAIE